ncbi:hypothetical protein CPT_Moonbeam101 [Bacillus phage Moonbeam]|uniref:Uncharacterized protein n=1 Tax=Bacillus phage Moonbeam TaxID=1540091 RepID=A0A0A0RPH9_9CAUD|nr:hypothetical protein CPT_Moonbeam101 [Bacillus phage Moonbeam]AIW03499.1 hypothetical protein CPT_Moonbeam101 [Bacillus phage Moonbeam]
MSENRVLEVMENIIYLRQQTDTGLKEMLEDTKDEIVNLYDVAKAFISVTDDLAIYIDASQAATETRMIDIIKALPEDVQTKIKASFSESEDDLLEEK